ncbi:FRG domain-containing protein [Bradyrhizobium sp.]|uniref:FRG domain-containing protein n=1 Tax=Bradyrhizobium sp. TaxID=376 RepID=UPI003C370213
MPQLFGLNRLLGFRGQQAKYDTIIPTLFRKSEDVQKLHLRARGWFSTAISAWHNSSFRYADEQFDQLGVERETATGIAQHYGLATDFVDWTWDPLVAMVFAVAEAVPGDLVSVFIRPFGPASRPHEAYNVFLPPSFARRAWRQHGFFSWQPVAPQFFDDASVRMIDGGLNRKRSRAASHHRVSFPVTAEDIAWAKPQLDALYEEEFEQLLALVSWCLTAAADNSDRTPWSVTWHDRDFIAECDRRKLEPPTLFTTSPPASATRENIPEMMDYLEIMALRQRPSGSLAYHKPALLTALVALPRKSFPKVRESNAAALDSRAVTLPPDPTRLVRWSDDVRAFDPAQDLLTPSDEYFVDRLEVPSSALLE